MRLYNCISPKHVQSILCSLDAFMAQSQGTEVILPLIAVFMGHAMDQEVGLQLLIEEP
jgi:hypothetical protein